jgi:DNA-3-methyladenine glycosylase
VHSERGGAIVEVEAYVGPDDKASHARVGRKGRAAIMFGPAGFAYVYQIYGVHFCFNVVAETDG